jgi:putative transposase
VARDLVIDALVMALWRRKPSHDVIFHSDRGSQYGSDDWQRFCRSHRFSPSMSRRGNCWDNAVAESFFSSLKKERIRKRVYKTRDLARADVFDYIEMFYNSTRRHSHLGGVSPEAFDGRPARAGRPGRSDGSFDLFEAVPRNPTRRPAMKRPFPPYVGIPPISAALRSLSAWCTPRAAV